MSIETPPPHVLGNRVLIRQETAGERYKSIIIPEKYRQIPQEGVVVAVGPLVTTLSTGDRVLYGRYAGLPVTLDDRAYVLLWERDVLAVLE